MINKGFVGADKINIKRKYFILH